MASAQQCGNAASCLQKTFQPKAHIPILGMDGRRNRGLFTPGDAKHALPYFFVAREFWQLFWPGEGPIAMHGILGVGGRAQCAFSLQSFIIGIRRGVGTTVRCGPIHDLALKLFSNNCLA